LDKAGITIYLSYNTATTYIVSINHEDRFALRKNWKQLSTEADSQ